MSDNMDAEDEFLYGDLNATAAAAAADADVDVDQSGDVDMNGSGSQHNGEGSDVNDEEESAKGDSSEVIILEPGKTGADNQPTVATAAETEAGADEKAKTDGDASMQALFAGGVDRLDLLTIDIDMLDEKPWRLPGADITDYFNFGFHEETWKVYCMKQRQLRTEFGMYKMMPPAMMMMPGAQGMPNPAMFSGMYPPAPGRRLCAQSSSSLEDRKAAKTMPM
ncbi:Fip1 motif-domain-containing protein [Kickxella alabastrina]|uniref:Fip1 motif-domain-containing protein n=1 Tax=Kickxella alabastrina TaxID=61397 RepID=UPI00221F0A99|nr:Fip1 motif-domain-containing protein [Kickxella alabastrina]KAI7829036.1 Fip1 motif-domain-containing protein [Kickxella alabastrina]